MQKTVWEAKKESGEHPTIKPVDLIVRALVNSSKPDDIVADYFGGSGSTLIACEKLKRKCYMIEIDPHYCDVIVKRWEDYSGKKAGLDGKNRPKTKTDKTKNLRGHKEKPN